MDVIVKRVIDGKYAISQNGDLINSKTGEILPLDEPLFLLRGKDQVALETLEAYRDACEVENCSKEHLVGIDYEIEKFSDFANANGNRLKLPD